MQKLKTFARAFTQSIGSFTYYRDVVKAPLSFSFKYFFLFTTLLTITATGVIGYFVATEIPPVIDRAITYAQTFYPDDLEFTIQDGTLSVNREEPFVVPAPVEIFVGDNVAIPDRERINLFVYDSSAKLVDFEDYNTLILATDQVLIVQDDSTGIRSYPLKDAEDEVIDKQTVDEMVETVAPFIQYLVPLVIGIIFLFLLIFIPTFKLLSLLFFSFVFLIVGRFVIHLKLPYSKYYQIGLHSITLPTLAEATFIVAGIQTPFAGFFSLFIALYTFIILSHIREKSA